MFGDHVLNYPMLKSTAVSDAGITKQTLYEVSRADATSDERFNKVSEAVSQKRTRSSQPTVWTSDDGKAVAQIKQDERNVTLVVDQKVAPDFGAYLIRALPEIYAAFKRGGE